MIYHDRGLGGAMAEVRYGERMSMIAAQTKPIIEERRVLGEISSEVLNSNGPQRVSSFFSTNTSSPVNKK